MSSSTRNLYVVAKGEWRAIERRRSYLGLFLGYVALLALAAALGGGKQARERERQEGYQELARAQWEGQPERHPHRVAHYGTFAFKPPGPLATIDPGVDGYAGRSLFLEAHRQNASNFAEAGELSSVSRLGELSLAFVWHVALPLIVVALGYGSLVDERESGRLRLLAAQGVSGRALALGKVLGLGFAVGPLVGAGLLVGLVAVARDPAFAAGPGAAIGRLGLLGLVMVLHVGAWCSVSVWVSGRSRSAAQACGTLLCLWIFGCIVLPRVSGVVAESLHPLPDKSSFQRAVQVDTRKQGDSHNPNDPNFGSFRREILERYGVERVEDLPVNYGALVMAYGETLSAETFARHFARLGDRMQAQAEVVERAGLLAPFLAARSLSAIGAGTDLRAQLRFQQEAEAYRYRFVQELNALHRDEIRHAGDKDQKLGPDRWLAIADFEYVAPTLGESLSGSGFAWLALGLWLAGPTFLLSLYRIEVS